MLSESLTLVLTQPQCRNLGSGVMRSFISSFSVSCVAVFAIICFATIISVSDASAASPASKCTKVSNKIDSLYNKMIRLSLKGKSLNRVESQLAKETKRYKKSCSSSDDIFCPQVYEPVCGSVITDLCVSTDSYQCYDNGGLKLVTFSNLCTLMRDGGTYLFAGNCLGQ